MSNSVLLVASGLLFGWLSMYMFVAGNTPATPSLQCPTVECPRAVCPACVQQQCSPCAACPLQQACPACPNCPACQQCQACQQCPPQVTCQTCAKCPACPSAGASAASASSSNNAVALAKRDLALFPQIQRPYQCQNPGQLVHIALRQPFITADPQPVNFAMHLHPAHEDVHVSASIYHDQGNRMFEMDIKARIYRILRGADGSFRRPTDPLFLDVGANIGIHSLFTAALGIRTHAFEPMPKNLNLLHCSLASNPGLSKHFTLNPFALSDKTSEGGCMNVEHGNQGNSFFDMQNTNCVSTGIKLRTLDDYWRQVLNEEQPFLMKMDVQGFEGFVIKGAPTMFKNKPPVFFMMEYTPSRYRTYGIDAAQILRDLIGYGYSIKTFRGSEPITLHNGVIERLANAPDGHEFDLDLIHDASFNKYTAGQLSF